MEVELVVELLEALDDPFLFERLDDEVLRAGLDGGDHHVLLPDCGTHDDPGGRIDLNDLAYGGEPVHNRHGDIHQHDIRLAGNEHLHGFRAVGGLGGNFVAIRDENVFQ